MRKYHIHLKELNEGDLQARKGARTNRGANVVDGVALPHLLPMFIEGQLWKDKGGDEGLKVWFELNPCRLGLDAGMGY